MAIADITKQLKRTAIPQIRRHPQGARTKASIDRRRRMSLVGCYLGTIFIVTLAASSVTAELSIADTPIQGFVIAQDAGLAATSEITTAASSGCPGRDVLVMTLDVVPPGGGALHAAVLEGSLAQVQKLIMSGSNVDEPNNWQATPLFNAVAFGHNDIGKYLIDHGANIRARDSAQFTPLHLAAFGCNEEMVRVLLDKGADVNAKSTEENGYTPLHSAIDGGAPLSLVKLLVARGAEINVRGSAQACTPLCLAKKVGRKDIAKFLEGHGGR